MLAKNRTKELHVVTLQVVTGAEAAIISNQVRQPVLYKARPYLDEADPTGKIAARHLGAKGAAESRAEQ